MKSIFNMGVKSGCLSTVKQYFTLSTLDFYLESSNVMFLLHHAMYILWYIPLRAHDDHINVCLICETIDIKYQHRETTFY